MLIALISDVHGNLPAFEAVLADVDSTAAEEIWCLGDLVGYGAQPDDCVELARKRCDFCLAGNHDLVVTGEIDISDFSSSAAAAAARGRASTSAPTRSSSCAGWRRSGATARSASTTPRRAIPVWEYVLSTWQADECMDLMNPRIGAIGHSHVALWFRREVEGQTEGEVAAGGLEHDLSEGEWLLNPGGVGQPRDGDPRAAWLLLDTEKWSAQWRRVEYPIDEAAKAIEEAGLPKVLAERLYTGQ